VVGGEERVREKGVGHGGVTAVHVRVVVRVGLGLEAQFKKNSAWLGRGTQKGFFKYKTTFNPFDGKDG